MLYFLVVAKNFVDIGSHSIAAVLVFFVSTLARK